jgi:hypothetical protein
MSITVFPLWILSLTTSFTFLLNSTEITVANEVNYECVSVEEFDNTTNPEEMYSALWGCIDQGDFENAAKVFALSAAYSAYDQRRIVDRNAYQIFEQNKAAEYQMTEENRAALMTALDALLKPGSESLAQMCSLIKDKGQPTYFPHYLVKHSSEATFELDDDGLDNNFDGDASWEQILRSFLNCD